jgi:ribosomal protein L19E
MVTAAGLLTATASSDQPGGQTGPGGRRGARESRQPRGRAHAGIRLARNLLGLLPEPRLHDARNTLRPGDILILFTDGVTRPASNRP